MITLEICVDDPAGLDAALAGGADRIELCSALSCGGLTPATSFMRLAARRANVPVFAMIRPRDGDFGVDDDMLALMLSDIETAAVAGLDGVVFGALRRDGGLDHDRLRALVRHARLHRLAATLHRAVDAIADPVGAIEAAAALGFDRVLAAGGATDVVAGLSWLRAALIAADRAGIVLMPGGGVSPETLPMLREALPSLRDIHASASRPADAATPAPPGFEIARRNTDPAAVRALKQGTSLWDPPAAAC